MRTITEFIQGWKAGRDFETKGAFCYLDKGGFRGLFKTLPRDPRDYRKDKELDDWFKEDPDITIFGELVGITGSTGFTFVSEERYKL